MSKPPTIPPDRHPEAREAADRDALVRRALELTHKAEVLIATAKELFIEALMAEEKPR